MTNVAQLLAICIGRSIDPRGVESQITPRPETLTG
jgi:hypothetical protein